jgi:hypothetical protein
VAAIAPAEGWKSEWIGVWNESVVAGVG